MQYVDVRQLDYDALSKAVKEVQIRLKPTRKNSAAPMKKRYLLLLLLLQLLLPAGLHRETLTLGYNKKGNRFYHKIQS